MFKILLSLISYTIEGGFFTLVAMSITQGDWWYTFSFSTLLVFWSIAIYFAITGE